MDLSPRAAEHWADVEQALPFPKTAWVMIALALLKSEYASMENVLHSIAVGEISGDAAKYAARTVVAPRAEDWVQ